MSRKPPSDKRNIQTLTIYESAYLNRTLLALDGARTIQQNDQATPVIFPNTGLTRATQDYLLNHHRQLVLETTQPIGNPRNTIIVQKAISVLLGTSAGHYTVYYAYDQINNKRLGLPTDILN